MAAVEQEQEALRKELLKRVQPLGSATWRARAKLRDFRVGDCIVVAGVRKG